MTDDVLDILLRHAFLDALREDAAEVKTRVAYTPSVQHQREMRRMLADPLGWRRSRLQARHKGRKVFMRVAAVLLALLIGAGIWLSVDEEAQAALERWIWYELNAKKNYGFLYDDSDLQRVPHYYIGWVPEGFFLSEDDYYEYGGGIVYLTEAEDMAVSIGLSYFPRSSSTIGTYAPENDGKPEKLRINGMDAMYYRNAENNLSELIWLNEKYDLVFSLGSSLGKEDCIRVAESIYAEEAEESVRHTEIRGIPKYSLDAPGRYAAVCRQAEEIKQRVAAQRQERLDEQERTGLIQNPDTGETVELASVSEKTRTEWNDRLDMELISPGDAYILFSAADPHAEEIERQQRMAVEAERLEEKIRSGRVLTEKEMSFLRENFPWIAEMAEGNP